MTRDRVAEVDSMHWDEAQFMGETGCSSIMECPFGPAAAVKHCGASSHGPHLLFGM